jgi:hypothetical protein
MILGIRNRNPFNIKNNPAQPWEGSVSSDSKGHAIFEHEIYGIRAAVRVLAKKYLGGKKTLRQIIESFAPASDGNDPEAYIAAVLKFNGWDVAGFEDCDLELFFESGLPTNAVYHLLRAMVQVELYAGYRICNELLESGIALYVRDFARK